MKDMIPFLLLGAVGYLLFQQMQSQKNPYAGYPSCAQVGPLQSCLDPSGKLVVS
jgi:hypothetical protein